MMIKMKKERGGVSGSEWRVVCRDPTWRIRKRCLSCRRQGRVWAEGELKNWGELILRLACLTRFWGFSICVVCGPEYWVKVKLYGGWLKTTTLLLSDKRSREGYFHDYLALKLTKPWNSTRVLWEHAGF